MLHLSTKDVCQVFAAAHHLQMTEVTAFVLLSSLKTMFVKKRILIYDSLVVLKININV